MIQDRLRVFMTDQLNWPGPASKLTNDYPLLENNVLDSLGMFEILSFVESEFSVEIANDELIPSNFGTIDDIARLIASKQPA